MRVLKSWYTASGPKHEIRRCFADGLNQNFVSSEAQATISQGDVTILWSPDVDYQLMGHFIFGVQRNGMGYLTILGTLKILIVISGDFLIRYFIRNNFEYILNNFECILNLIELL